MFFFCRVGRQTFDASFLIRLIVEEKSLSCVFLCTRELKVPDLFVLWELIIVLRFWKTNSFLVVVVDSSSTITVWNFLLLWIKKSRIELFSNASFNRDNVKFCFLDVSVQTHLLIATTATFSHCFVIQLNLARSISTTTILPCHQEYVSRRLDIAATHVLLFVVSCRCFYIQFFLFFCLAHSMSNMFCNTAVSK